MKLFGAVLGFCLFAVSGAGLADTLTLDGSLSQGGLIVGHAPPGTRIELDGKTVRVAEDGLFAFGFGRDAAPEANLVITYSGGAIERRTLAIGQRQYRVQRIDGLPPAMVTPPPEVLARIRRENARIAEARARDTRANWFEGGFIRPTEGPVSGVYGSQRILNGEPRRPHYGLDIAPPEGTAVIAPAGGIVALAETALYYTGGTVMIDHGHGVVSVFSHLSALDVEEGQSVEQGTRIGAVGSTGRATGPHLDWRVNWFTERLDPALLID